MVDPQSGWAVHDSEDGSAHVLKTIDGGLTWADVSPPESVYLDNLAIGPFAFRVATEFLDADHAWVSLSFNLWPGIRTVWRTTDGGRHWDQGLLGRRTFGNDWVFFDFIDPLHGWAVIDVFLGAGSHTGEAFRTSDGGLTWERLLLGFSYASGIDFLDQRVGWITTDVFEGVSPPWAVFITRDGGLTWELHSLDSRSPVPEAFPGEADCPFRLLRVTSPSSGVVLRPGCGSQDSQGNPTVTSWLDFTTDGMETWEPIRIPSGSPDFLDSSLGWGVGPTDPNGPLPPPSWSLFRTRDGGRIWQSHRQLDWYGDLDFVDEQHAWGIDKEGTLRRSIDGGLSWEEVPARSIAAEPPQDTTMSKELPPDLTPISLEVAFGLEVLGTLPADDPTCLVIFRDTLFVGNAHGQVLQWTLGPAVHEQPAIWRVHDDWVYDLAAVDMGGDLATASRDGSVRLWPLFASDGIWADFPGQDGEMLSVAFSPGGSTFASGGEDGTIRVQEEFSKQTKALRGHRGWVWDLAFSGDGSTLASASRDGTVKLWSVESGELLATLSGHTATVSQVAFAPDDSRIASASWDGTVRIWDATTHDTLHTLKGHSDWVLGLAYSPSGDLLVSSGADGKVLLWDANKGELISQLVDLDAPVRAVAFDEQSRYLVAVADDDRVLIWGIAP